MLGLGHILISDLVVANLLMHSLRGMILLYLATPFFTPKVFLDEISLHILELFTYHKLIGVVHSSCDIHVVLL